MPYFTTATELQRNYKKVVKRAKKIKKPITVLSNNKPELVVMDYDVFGLESTKEDLLSLAGTMSEKEADELNKIMDETFETIDEDLWK